MSSARCLRSPHRVTSAGSIRRPEGEGRWHRPRWTPSTYGIARTWSGYRHAGSRTGSASIGKLVIMQATIFWVTGPWRGRLGIVTRPRGGDWLEDETAAWRVAGIDMVVSLLEAEEEAQLVLQGEAAAAKASGIEFKAFPIPDRGVPDSKELVAELADEIVDALETGKNVAVHCRQGIGRSGLIVGGVLMAAGEDVPTALATIKESRGLDVPETEEQQEWLREFSLWLTSRVARPAAAVDGKRSLRRSSSRRS